MSYCLNPNCSRPTSNSVSVKFCTSCGSKLLLAERYRATKQIGQGGFGRTFKAIDEYKPSQPNCVIKQFLPPQPSPQHPILSPHDLPTHSQPSPQNSIFSPDDL